MNNPKETDLIYEGIATQGEPDRSAGVGGQKETDLIYEGIATCRLFSFLSFLLKETDLIYEGIATSAYPPVFPTHLT